MDTQQVLSLGVVVATAGLFILSAVKKKRGGAATTCGENCACSGPVPSPESSHPSSPRTENA